MGVNALREQISEVLLTLEGELQSFSAITVAESLRHLAQLVESFPTHEGSAKLATLREGSAVTGVLTNAETAVTLSDGIAHLHDHESVPEAWSIDQARSFKKLIDATVSRHEATLTVDRSSAISLDSRLRDAVSKAVSNIPKSIGTVIGELTRYNGAGPSKFAGLLQEGTQKIIDVGLGENLWQDVIQNMHQRVEIAGLVTRHPETNQIEKILARSIEELPEKGSPISGLGIWQDVDFRGQSPEEIVRHLRDG